MEIEGIVLAAGFSSRACTYKMTLELGGKTVIEQCIEGMYDICSRVIVVGGHRIEYLEFLLDKYSKIELVFNEKFEEGMFSSVKKGISCIREERCFLIPGDYPLISRRVYESMLEVDSDIVIPVYKHQRGHPVLMKKEAAISLLRSPQYKNVRDFIHFRGFTPVVVEEEGILFDIDTIEDYETLKKKILN